MSGREEGEMEGNSFSIATLPLNHPTWEWREQQRRRKRG